ncbi:MAG: hypothetical protein FWB71_01335, partial [Defluviitaleaceae bacterium]|nr:hypothetical protein [Defluviitaleaceae bacterium]
MSRKTIKELLPDLITFVLAFNIFAAMHLFVYEQLPWIFLLALLPFFVLYLSRRFMINLLIFLILHLAYIGLPMLIFSGALRWNLFGFTLITGAYSIYIHSRDDTTMFKHIDKYTVAIFGIIAFIYGWLDFGTPAAMSFLIISTITTFCMIIACRSMANVDFSLMVMHDRYKKQPTNDVVATNNAMIAVFLIGIIVLAVLSAVLPMGAIASGVLGFIWSIFGLIIYGFVRIIAIFLPYIREMDAPEHEGAPIVVDTQPPFDYEYLLDLDIAWGLFGRIAGIIAGIFVLYLLVLLMFRIS